MRRREFMALVGGGALTWSLAARAQQPGPPLIGYLSGYSPDAFGLNVRMTASSRVKTL